MEYTKDEYLEVPGTYLAEIRAVTDRPTKSGKARVGFKFVITEGEASGKVIWNSLFSPAALSGFMARIGRKERFDRLPEAKALLGAKGATVEINVVQKGQWLNVDAKQCPKPTVVENQDVLTHVEDTTRRSDDVPF